MGIDDIYVAIAILFLLGIIFFTFKKVTFIDKLDAIFVCISGFFIYVCLAGAYMENYDIFTPIGVILFYLWILFMIYFLIRKPKYFKRWEVVIFSLAEMIISSIFIEPITNFIIK